MQKYIGIDMGASSTKAGLVEDGKIIYKVSAKTPVPMKAEQFFETVESLIDKVLSNNNLAPNQIAGIGMGLPCTISADEGIIISNGNLGHLFSNLNVVEPIKAKYNIKNVKIANDVSCFALAEKKLGGHENLVYIAIGTGVNIGVINKGQLFAGARGINLEYGATSCGDSIVDETLSGIGIRAACKRQNLNISHPGEVFEIYDTNPRAKKVVDDFVEVLKQVLYNLVNSYRPGTIFIGGGLALGLARFKNEIETTFQNNKNGGKFSRSPVKIIFSELATTGGTIGAASLCEFVF